MKKVSKEEFEKFIDKYPRPLVSTSVLFGDPHFVSFRDESLPTESEVGTFKYFFDKEVARISMEWLGPNGKKAKVGDEEFWEYKIKDSLYAK